MKLIDRLKRYSSIRPIAREVVYGISSVVDRLNQTYRQLAGKSPIDPNTVELYDPIQKKVYMKIDISKEPRTQNVPLPQLTFAHLQQVMDLERRLNTGLYWRNIPSENKNN